MANTLFIDCTHTYYSGSNTGIQRVIRNLISQASIIGPSFGYQVKPVILKNGHFVVVPPVEAIRDKNKIRGLKHWRALLKNIREKRLDNYSTQAGNILLIPEISALIEYRLAVIDFKLKGGNVQTIIYDLIPLTHPDTVSLDSPGIFKDWFDLAIRHSAQLIAISQTAKKEVERYLKNDKTLINKPATDYFHLGSHLDLKDRQKASQSFISLFGGGQPVFIMVGSIEPRKNHRYALGAFNIFWRRGGKAKLIFIGQAGWRNENLLAEIKNHRFYNKRLFLVRSADDNDLDFAYKNATGLIFPSIVEGFGLPIVEAWQAGLKVFCSDIPIFRELANGRATFFDLASPESLASLLFEYCHQPKDLLSKKEKHQWPSWSESVGKLFPVLIKGQILSKKLSDEEKNDLLAEQADLLVKNK
ncbi:MAG: glycosyltransferase family 1 protein, partial [Candidatus Paceibacterota bacterium]